MSGSGRPIARLNATDVNAIFDMSSTQSLPGGDGFKPVRGTDAGVFDIHEHDVLLQKASQPFGQRQLAVFSSLRNVQDLGEDDRNIQNIKNKYKFAGLAVTPFYVKLGADQFQPTQGFVSTFTGLNTVRVACDVLAGDILVAAPPLKCCRSKLHELVGKHTGPVMLVYSVRYLKKQEGIDCNDLKSMVIGRCVGAARAGQNCTLVLGGSCNFEC